MSEQTNDAAPRQMTARAVGWTVTIPPGTYFLGDPCYAVPDDLWMPLLLSCNYFDAGDLPGYGGPVGTVGGQQVLGFGTRWGDGTYYDTEGHEYSVDAGLIGLVPEALWAGREKYDLADLGRVVTFEAEAEASTDGSGLLIFGPYKIDTNPAYDEDDEGEWR